MMIDLSTDCFKFYENNNIRQFNNFMISDASPQAQWTVDANRTVPERA